MNDRGPELLAVLNRAAAGITEQSDALRCIGVIAELQQQLSDLGFGSPMHPEAELQLARISGMVSDLHAALPASAGRALAAEAAPDDGADVPHERSSRLSQLASRMAGCSVLSICDAGLLQGMAGISPRTHLSDIISALPSGLSQLEIFVKPGKRDTIIASGLHEHCAGRGIALVHRLTKELHDRVWIFDHRRAFSIGASFNGLSDQCAFIVELSREDRERFVGKLRLVRERARWAPGGNSEEP